MAEDTYNRSRANLRMRDSKAKHLAPWGHSVSVQGDGMKELVDHEHLWEQGYREGLKDGVRDGITGMEALVRDLEVERDALRESLSAA